jgi:hypothetical protein
MRNSLMAAMFGQPATSTPESTPGAGSPSAGTKVDDVTLSETAAKGISDMEKYKQLMRAMNGENPLNDECAQP